MPELCRFQGLVITMYHNEHGVPHFHVRYAEFKATIEVESERVHGTLPRKVLGLALDWGRVHRAEYRRTGAGHVTARHSSAYFHWSDRMEYDVLEARYVSGFTIWLRFRDGRSGEVDLTHAMNGPVFEPLHDVEFFRQFRVHPEWETLVWPNGADMAPEFLYEHVRVAA